MNSDVVDIDLKETLLKAEMESENYQLQLQESKKKMAGLTEQLDNVLKYNCKLGVGMDYVIATVNELQSLMEWTAEKKETKEDSNIIFQKLQQLERIQKDLEKTALESEQIRSKAEQERVSSTPCDSPICRDDNIDAIENAKMLELCDTSVHDDHMIILDNCLKKIESLSSSRNVQSFDQSDDGDKDVLLIDLDTPESEDTKTGSPPSFELPCPKSKNNGSRHDSLGQNISEDEGLGEESRRGDSTGPSSFIDLQDTLTNIAKMSTRMQYPLSGEITVTDPEGHQTTKESLSSATAQKNSLDFCLCAIGNLRESLKTKEDELLKLSTLQSDQKRIAALQDVVITLHKDAATLNSDLEGTKKENAMLKEQVLELEEAENDARLESQKLGEKLTFLQEKDTHFQAKLCETQQVLEKSLDDLNVKESIERELRSQLKYTEALVQKYEDQIRTMETVEIALRKKLMEDDNELKALEELIAESKTEKRERGTQMYDLPPSLCHVCNSDKSPWGDKTDESSSCPNNKVDVCLQIPDTNICATKTANCYIQTEDFLLTNQLVRSQMLAFVDRNAKASTAEEGQGPSQPTTKSIECPIEKELLIRLHQLVDEDAHLQQQLHHVDQINLTLWKKLHNLEFHIGECKKKNVPEDCASDSCIDSEWEYFSSRPVSREQICDESSLNSKCVSPTSSRGIIACLDHNEQEIKEKLTKLEHINASFEKELELREKLYLEKEKKYEEWVQTEQRLLGDLKRMSNERDSLANQVEQLEKEKEKLALLVLELQAELERANQQHSLEMDTIRREQEEISAHVKKKVEQLLAKEKEHLKQITNLKVEKSKNSDKSVSDQLKSSYVELQLELSRTREDMRKKEEEFRMRLDDCRSKHLMEEARLVSEIEVMRGKNSYCDEMINNFQSRQRELMDILKSKEYDLEMAREEYKMNIEATEEEHRLVEAELKSQLRQMEEGTYITTKVLTEERIRLEKELQENIEDLRSKEEVYKARITELESNVSHLHEELHRITGDLDSGFGSDGSNGGLSSFRREKLFNQLKELRDRESELREKLDEMEQKEAAYRETLEHADRIVASVEMGYKNKIEELEISERNLKQRVLHLEEVESCLRGALHKEKRSSDGRKPDDLVVELLEAEAREINLKEKFISLEQLQRSSMSKVKDLEKVRERLENQLGDKEYLASTLEKTQQELDIARKALSKLKKSESDLKASLHHSENMLMTTETQMRNKIQTIEEEKRVLEETIIELRAQVRGMQRLEQISYEREQQRMSVTVPKKAALLSGMPGSIADDEPDYVDVDDCFTEPKQEATNSCVNNFNKNNPIKAADAYTSRLSSNYASQKMSSLPREYKSNQSTSKPSDSYDSARQNLEDCMLRAMAAMENDMHKKVPLEQTENEDNDYDEVLPRPTNLRVIQQVGSDTLLIGWNYVNLSILEGYEVYINGQLHETVYTPDRTKALISGLNLKKPLRLSICALSRHGQMSEPTVLEVPTQQGNNGPHFQDDDNHGLFDESTLEKQRPYSMEW